MKCFQVEVAGSRWMVIILSSCEKRRSSKSLSVLVTSRGTVHRPSVYRSMAGAAILFYDRMSGLGVKVVFPAINNYQKCSLCALFTGRRCCVCVCVCDYLTTDPTCDKWNILNGRAPVVTLGCLFSRAFSGVLRR